MDDAVLTLIKSYVPSQKTVELLRSKKLIIFAGITSAGKNTIMNELIKTGKYYDVVTSTTRPPRENDGVMEVDGVDYYFLSTEEAIEKIKRGEYVEVANVHGRVNGILAQAFNTEGNEGKTPVIDIDVQGVDYVKSLSENAIAIFVVPPSFTEWVKRMRNRYPSDEAFYEAWPERRNSAIMELEMALSKPYYHFIVNENITEAVHSAQVIAEKADEFNQIDRSYHVWAEQILENLKESTDG